MPTASIISFRLGMSDGVSVVAGSWRRALAEIGFATRTVAGEGPVDVVIDELRLDADRPPDPDAVADALADADLVVVENLLTIPLHLGASRVVAEVLRGRPAVLHHHDPPWQRTHFEHITELPPDDPAWVHVVINDLTRHQFADRGVGAVTIHNGFATTEPPGDRNTTRARYGFAPTETVVLHPVRAIARKGIPRALRLCEHLGATYWLPGGAEEDYAPTLERLLTSTTARVVRDPVALPVTMADAYAACDVVAFPSRWEGFGNPPVEAAIHRRPAVVADYPVAVELRGYGFDWFDHRDVAGVAAFLAEPDPGLLDRNAAVAHRHFSQDMVVRRLRALLDEQGWTP